MIPPALTAVLSAPPSLPRVLTDAVIHIRYHSGVDFDVYADVLADELSIMSPLFAAGFMSIAPAPKLVFGLEQDVTGLIIKISGANHSPALLHLLLRYIHLSHQSPPGAFEALVEMLQSEEDARSVFVPVVFENMVASVTVTVPPFDEATAVAFEAAAVERDGIHAQLQTQLASLGDSYAITIARPLALNQQIEHAFLTADALNLWALDGPAQKVEPEFFTKPSGDNTVLNVSDYRGHPWFISEFVWVLADKDLSRVKGIEALDADD